MSPWGTYVQILAYNPRYILKGIVFNWNIVLKYEVFQK